MTTIALNNKIGFYEKTYFALCLLFLLNYDDSIFSLSEADHREYFLCNLLPTYLHCIHLSAIF